MVTIRSSSELCPRLYGRRSECQTLDQLVAGARSGRSQVLVLRGEAGIGKSALVKSLVGSAPEVGTALAVCVESEMELAFAGLHQLCLPMMAHLDRLPGPQREALAIAFGLTTGSTPDRFLVGLAVLSLLAAAAEEQPLVCVVDDAQWLDRESAQTLAFVARRTLAERVVLVFAVRDPTTGPSDDHFEGLPELVIRGLRDTDARALLDSVVPGRLDRRVKDRIIAETRGNPLALLELPRGLSTAELAGGFGRPDAQPLESRIEQSFVRRIESLPVATQKLLLAAAAEPVGDVSLLRRVTDRLAIGPEAAAAAEEAGLIELDARVRFIHPLARSAAYRVASPRDRQEVHRALAESTDPEIDPDRRAWHRAHAAVDPDEAVSGDLERSANRARARGGVGAAAAFLKRAAELTPDPGRRAERALAAADATLEAGAYDTALKLLHAAEMGPLGERQRAQLARLGGQMDFARKRNGEAVPLLLDAANRLERLDAGQAREAYLEALGGALYAGRLAGQGGLRAVADAARAAPAGPQPPRPLDALLDGMVTRVTEGYIAGEAPLRRALQAFRRDAGRNEDENTRALWLTWMVAIDMWDDETWHELVTHAVQRARDAGALNFLPLALAYQGFVHVFAGEYAAASASFEESDAIAEAAGTAPLKHGPLLFPAWRGANGEEASALIQVDVQEAIARGEGRAIGRDAYMSAVLYNGLGRYEDAVTSAERACEYDDLGYFNFSLVELIEAGARSDAPDVAATALRQLEERATASGTDWALGVLAQSRALLSSGRAAELLYQEAIERLERTRVAIQHARAHLVYGEWLRRENRRFDAREQLQTAYEMLDRFGAEAFAGRARRELLATGASVRPRTNEPQRTLTSQEAHIAGLASRGMTNSEIGAQLFISPRTVEWHLSKVFAKLDINSRNKLREALQVA
jgi:DNA-binding CsgD family transcriptional regulator